MLTIRLNRTGKRNRPYFRVVLQEHTKAPGKRHVEVLGSYDTMKKTAVLKKERILYWLGQGVKVSDTVHNLLIREGVIQTEKRTVKIPKPVAKEETKAEEKTEEKTETPAAPVTETARETAEVPHEAPKEVPAEVKEEAKPEEVSKTP